MDLHRASAKADWENIEPSRRTRLQRVASATRGFITPPNVITVIGFAVVMYGLVLILQQQLLLGLILLIVGRLLDIVDGLVAAVTHTKSPLGEIFDAAADKVGTLLTIVVLIIAGITYWWVIVALIAPQVIIPFVSFYKKRKGINVHPTRPGKLSMLFLWVGIGALLIVKTFSELQAFIAVVYVVLGVSFVLGVYALWQYSTGRDQS